jgi:hypothetical protein
MKARAGISLAALVLATVVVSPAQNKASVQMEKVGPLHGGDPIAFKVKLNEPLPKAAHFDFRISPISADEEIDLGSGEPVNGSETDFRISGKLPEAAVPGEWHISVIYLFLPGAGWTHNTIASNDLRFHVEGKPYPIPTKADVTLDRN